MTHHDEADCTKKYDAKVLINELLEAEYDCMKLSVYSTAMEWEKRSNRRNKAIKDITAAIERK